MRIAMLGTRGVPARYGGFETAVEEIGQRLASRGHDVYVYCRNRDQNLVEYRGMRLVNVGAVRSKKLETLSHTAASVFRMRGTNFDVAMLFNSGNAPLIRPLRRRGLPVVVHVDGLEWKRAKWQGVGARYYRWAERESACSASALVSDSKGIAQYFLEKYGRDSYVITYGAPILHPGADKLESINIEPQGYHLVVARLEPENHVHTIIEGYRRLDDALPLVIVGSAPYGERYCAELRDAAAGKPVRFLGAVWDQDLLNQMYGNARSYLHGHSVGGTNPSLLRAMGCGAPVTAFDVTFNREVAGNFARYFSDADSLAACLAADDASTSAARRRGSLGRNRVKQAYRWDDVTVGYEAMFEEVLQRAGRR